MPLLQSKNLRVLDLADGVAAVVLDCEGKSNALTPAVVDEVDAALGRIAQTGRFRLLVFCSGKAASFAHGPDPAWLSAHGTPDALQAFARRGQLLCAKIAESPLPSVAVIAGACLGAGLELALACDYRVLVQRPATLLGLAQVELGLIPCWGGTQRLPRLIGLENSLKMLAGARRLRPREALTLGLVDAVCAEGASEPPALLDEPVKRDWSARPQRNWRQRFLEPYALGRRLIYRGARRVLGERLPQDMPAPWAALAALRLSAEHTDWLPGLAHEVQAVAQLAESPACINLVHLRLGRERRRALVPRPDAARFMRSIGIVGATETGVALVRQLLLKGCQVVLHDPDKTALGYASLKLHQAMMQEEVAHGTLSAAAALKCLQGFRGTAAWDHFDALDLVLDTIEDGKRAERFRQLDDVTTPATLLVSTGVADTALTLRAGLAHPLRVAVVHFAGPLGLEPIAELASPVDASEAVQRRLHEWIASLGKLCVPVADRPGLLVQRIWLPALNEAALLLREGMQLARIDEAMHRFGITPGPLELMDQIGLDAVARMVEALQPVFTGRLTLESGFAEMARQKLVGVASGAGFYRHAGRQRRANPHAVALWWAGPGEAWLSRTGLPHAQQLDVVQRRLTSLMVIEAYHCLRERIVGEPETIDFALATAGWAPHRGGPLTYGRQLGADVFIARLQELSRDFGPRFSPPPGLREMLSAPLL
jgi:3-hydroxyacyl-CoA dehydrogenase / enoyl-CoA hydratase / 3-hydroxybutyryl-CoA epimerase